MKKQLPFKILYFDLNEGSDFSEDYGYLNASRYGGGRVVASAFCYHYDNFFIASNAKGFESFTENESRANTIVLSNADRFAISKGFQVKSVIPNADDFDLFVTHHPSVHLNLSGCRSQKQTSWTIGWRETADERNKHIICFDFKHQQPQMDPNKHTFHHALIGNRVPAFQEYKKEDFLFFCSRQCDIMGTKELVNLCFFNKIPLILAGPLAEGYEDLTKAEEVTGGLIKYVGVISSDEKIDYMKRSRACPILHLWPSPGSLLGVEAQVYGNPLIVTNTGWWPSYIQQGKNGFIVNSKQDFLDAYAKSVVLLQRDCYNAGAVYNSDSMMEKFIKCFEEVYNEY